MPADTRPADWYAPGALVAYTRMHRKFLVGLFVGGSGRDFAAYGNIVAGERHDEEALGVNSSGAKTTYKVALALFPNAIRKLEDSGLAWRP